MKDFLIESVALCPRKVEGKEERENYSSSFARQNYTKLHELKMKQVSILLALAFLAGILFIVKQATASAGYEEILEMAREHRREENSPQGPLMGWRRKRSVRELSPTIDEKTANSFVTSSKQKKYSQKN